MTGLCTSSTGVSEPLGFGDLERGHSVEGGVVGVDEDVGTASPAPALDCEIEFAVAAISIVLKDGDGDEMCDIEVGEGSGGARKDGGSIEQGYADCAALATKIQQM